MVILREPYYVFAVVIQTMTCEPGVSDGRGVPAATSHKERRQHNPCGNPNPEPTKTSKKKTQTTKDKCSLGENRRAQTVPSSENPKLFNRQKTTRGFEKSYARKRDSPWHPRPPAHRRLRKRVHLGVASPRPRREQRGEQSERHHDGAHGGQPREDRPQHAGHCIPRLSSGTASLGCVDIDRGKAGVREG